MQDASGTPHIHDHEVFNQDNLRAVSRERYGFFCSRVVDPIGYCRKRVAERRILLAAKLVALNSAGMGSKANGALSSSDQAFDWVVEVVKASPHTEMAFEIEISKAVQYLKTREFSRAIETLKSFEMQDQKLVGTGIFFRLN